MAGLPTKIGKYDVLREIGRGGMGKVFAAVDPTIGRMVAIKQVTAVVSDDPDLLKRFYREAQSTGKLQHANIVTLHDLGEQDGVPYLVMEYLEGESLETIIRERRVYTVAEKLNIIIQVCEGLAYAHHRQIIHRDIKPGNIVVLKDGDVKVVDFGIAQFGNERFTRTGQVVGSLYYMSPEQIQDADIDSRSDIYSTGIVLYEFLTGAVPFRGKDPASTLAKILHGTPPSIASSVDAYAAELDEVLGRALAKDRNTRYTSMEDFAFDLRTVEEKLSQDLIATHLRAAEGLITAKQWDKAREILRQILKLDKQNRRANELLREVQTQIQRQQINEQVRQLRQRADEALALRKWDEALLALDQAVKIDSNNSELIRFRDSVSRSSALLTDALRRAESAHSAGDLDGAKSAVEEALSVDPYDTTAKVLNAILTKQISERGKRKKIDDLMVNARKEIALRRFSSSLEMLRAAEAIDPSVTEIQLLIRSATTGLEHERRRMALEKACAEIEDLLNRDEYPAACAKVDETLLAFPQDLSLLKLKGFAEKQREAWNRRQFLEAQVASARQFADSGEFLRAQRILNEALERYPDDAGAISLLGIVTDAIARQEAQRREAERQANEKRRYIEGQLDASAELQHNGRTAEALKKIRDGLARYAESEELKHRASVLEGALVREEAQRKRAEEEARHKKAEIERTIAESWQLLSTKQTGQAVAMLDEAVRRHPDSADLKSQLEFAQRRLAVAKAERERAEQEARRKAAEIQKEVAAAQHLMDSRQLDQAVVALEKTLSRYPDSEELKSLLQTAYRGQTAERAERELAEQEARQKHTEIEGEISAARELLDAKRTSESVARLQRAAGRNPDSEELKQLLTYAQQRLAAEETARKKAEEEEQRRRAWIDAEITVTRQWVSDKQADRAVTKLELALHQYPENEQLKAELDFARRRAAQEQAEKEKKEQEARRRREEINQAIRNALELLDSGKTSEAIASLEKAILRFPESQEIRMQIDLAKTRFAQEAAEKQRITEEARRRQAEIERALLSARQFLESEQTSGAVTALELAFQRYPDSTELKTQLAATRQRLASEEAERRRVEEENRRKQEEVKKELASVARLLDAGQLSQAIESLEGAIRRIPDSEELKVQLKRIQDRAATEEAARQKAEEERKRRQTEIANAAVNARRLLDSRQTSKAVSAIELAARNYPESEELKSLLAEAQATLGQERAAQEKAEREAQERRQKIATEIESAKQLLRMNQTAKGVAALEAALSCYPESEELRSQLAVGREQQARELAEKERAEKRQAQLLAERAKIETLLDGGTPEKAVEVTESALRTLGKDAQLQQLLDTAKAAVKAKKAEEKKRAAELHQAEEQTRRRERDLAEVNKLAASASSTAKRTALERLLRKAEEIARRYPNDAEMQKSLSKAKSGIERLLAEPDQPEAAETRLATNLFTPGQVVEAPAISTPTPLPGQAAQESPPPSLLPKLLNKWTAVAVVAVIAVGVMAKLLIHPKPVPSSYTLSVDSEPAGANVQIGNQTCVTPNCRLSLPAGEYRLDAQLSGYEPKSQSVVVDPKNSHSSLKLVFVRPPRVDTAGYLVIKAGVEGADVLVDGNKRSQTVSGGTLRLALGPGPHTVEVQKKGYASGRPASVQIEKGQDTTAEFVLTPLSTVSELMITRAIPNVEVLADNKVLGRTDGSGVFAHAIDPGSHEIALMQGDRRTNLVRKTFTAGGRLNVDGEVFAFAEPPRPMAILTITHLPGGALVKVEGASYGADQSGVVRLDIVAGEHVLDINADGYKSKQIQRSFSAGQLTIDGSLERLDLEGPEWAKLESSNDMVALQGFLNKYPAGNNAPQARSRLEQVIASSSSEQDLRAFHDKFPNTAFGDKAEKRADALRAANEQRAIDEAGIQTAVDRFNAAFQHHQPRELKDIWPHATSEYIEAMHPPGGASFSMALRATAKPVISDTTATLPCSLLSETTLPGGAPSKKEKAVRVNLYKTKKGWLISEPFGQ